MMPMRATSATTSCSVFLRRTTANHHFGVGGGVFRNCRRQHQNRPPALSARRWHATEKKTPHVPTNAEAQAQHPKNLSSSAYISAPTPPPSGNKMISEPILQHQQPKAFAIGTVAGIFGSLAGMGGGFVMIPLMTSPTILALSQHAAHGTSLFAVAATGIAGALGYGLHDVVDLDYAAALATCGMITARLGAAATAKLSEKRLRVALGIFMLCVAPLVPAKAYIARMHHDPPEEPHYKEKSNDDEEEEESELYTRLRRVVPAGMIGLGSGFLAGLFGVGGGAVVVPALAVVTDMTHYQALGTSLCAMSLPAIVGTFTHYQRGNVAMRIAPALAMGSFMGAYMGGKIGLSTPEDKLRYGFAGLMLFLGTRTLLRV